MWVQKVSGRVQVLAYAPDGRTLYVMDSSAWVTAWNVAARSSRRLFQLTGIDRTNTFAMLATADGNHLVIWTNDLQIWDISGEAKRIEPPAGFESNSAQLHADGRRLIVHGSRRRLVTWDIERREPGSSIAVPLKSNARLYAHAVAPDGRLFTVQQMNRSGNAWLVAGAEQWPFPEAYGWLYGMRFTPDGRALVCHGLGSDRLFVWDVASGAARPEARCRLFRGDCGATMHPTAPLLAGHNHDRTLLLVSLETGQVLRTFDFALGKHATCAAFAPDGLTCAVGGSNKRFAVFDVDV